MDDCCPTQEQTLAELERTAAGAPFLALGQTVFWDEPVKALVALKSKEFGSDRRFVAGVHDTDYFAKLHQKGRSTGYTAVPHNDTTTKGLWSAAGEFSALFGSETVVTREALHAAGAKLGRIQHERPGYLDEITEAWGWRGVVSLGPEQGTTAEKQLSSLFPEVYDTLNWAIETSLDLVAGPHRHDSDLVADRLRALACDTADDGPGQTLSDYYRRLLPEMYRLVGGDEVDVEATSTTELLRFNTTTAHLPRFEAFGLFVDPATHDQAYQAYNRAIEGTEIYALDRFGAGAVPFDLWIPGHGRGTLRLGTRGGLVMAPNPVGFSYKKRPASLTELADLLEKRFGPNCVLVGKAVTLIGMLAREFVFVFHEGASSYVRHSRTFHQNLAQAGHLLALNPLLRVNLEPWDALGECCAWFKLPQPLQRPFGADEISGGSFSARWREVASEQRQILKTLSALRRPLDLIQYLDSAVGGQWKCLAAQYKELHDDMSELNEKVASVKSRKLDTVAKIKAAVRAREAAERAKGQQWRQKVFEKSPTPEDLAERDRLTAAVEEAIAAIQTAQADWKVLQAEQDEIVRSAHVEKGRSLRANIAFEAELTRAKLVRDAIVASDGLEKAGHRPSGWWFPLVCPDKTWFRAMAQKARFRLEPLT